VAPLSDDVHIVDSFSNDRTLDIARSFGAKISQHAFENYGAQRNWAISSLTLKYDWQLHLDADERLTPELRHEIMELKEGAEISGFYLPRMMYFLGHPIRHGGLSPTWHMRLFKSGLGKCETRKYDQHFYLTSGKTSQLEGFMLDDVRMSLSEWTQRHNRWSDAEVEEQNAESSGGLVIGKMRGNPVEKKRFLRGLYGKCPPFTRAFLLFFYRYIIRLGFLDGSAGFVFYVLQTFWFRFLIDSKLFERRQARSVDEHCTTVSPALESLLPK
jgi:glycosyltransferase involved in cell wall biosynthesis